MHLDLGRRSPRRWWRSRKLRQDRVAIVSFPKSGRTWLRFMLDNVGVSPRFSHENSGRGASLEYTRDNIRFSPYRRVVFLHRNPLDTLVSYFHHAKNVQGRFDGEISAFVRDDRFGIRHILSFNKAWLEADSFDALMPLTYESLREDPEGQLRRIIDFCGITGVSDAAIARAVRAGDIERMRKLERSGKLARKYPGRFAEGATNRDASKVRSGNVGKYRDTLSQSDIDYCIAVAREVGWPLKELLAAGDPQLAAELQD